MIEPNWDEIVRKMLPELEREIAQQQPPGYKILLDWNNNWYMGSLQHIAPEYSDEIVLLSKSTNPIPLGLRDAILRAQPKKIKIQADNKLDLEGRLHVLRKKEGKLEIMTANQLSYVQNQRVTIKESNTGNVADTRETHIYI
ncbi:MAG: hypothetical protein AABX72_00135 [Nanoarchaeota archaeon]